MALNQVKIFEIDWVGARLILALVIVLIMILSPTFIEVIGGVVLIRWIIRVLSNGVRWWIGDYEVRFG